MQDFHSALLHQAFEGMLCHHCFLTCEVFLEVYKHIPREFVNEDCHILIMLLGKLALELGDEARGVGFQLVHQNNLPGPCGYLLIIFVVTLVRLQATYALLVYKGAHHSNEALPAHVTIPNHRSDFLAQGRTLSTGRRVMVLLYLSNRN